MPSHVYWYTTNTFLGNKSCLHHLSEVLPQYPRVSLKLWHFHSAQLEESKKCYFSRTQETKECYFSRTYVGRWEKERGGNDCLSGRRPWSSFNGLPQTILSPNISKFKFHQSLILPAALLWVLFFFFILAAWLTNYQFSTHLCNFTFIFWRIKTLHDLRPKWQWTDCW